VAHFASRFLIVESIPVALLRTGTLNSIRDSMSTHLAGLRGNGCPETSGKEAFVTDGQPGNTVVSGRHLMRGGVSAVRSNSQTRPQTQTKGVPRMRQLRLANFVAQL